MATKCILSYLFLAKANKKSQTLLLFPNTKRPFENSFDVPFIALAIEKLQYKYFFEDNMLLFNIIICEWISLLRPIISQKFF